KLLNEEMRFVVLIFANVLALQLEFAAQSALPGAHSITDLPKPADLPMQASLPDPLVMLDGRKVTTREMWKSERRPELIRLFQYYMYGQLPPKPANVTGKVERVDASAFGGKATLTEVTLRF